MIMQLFERLQKTGYGADIHRNLIDDFELFICSQKMKYAEKRINRMLEIYFCATFCLIVALRMLVS